MVVRALASLVIVVCAACPCFAQTTDGLYSEALSMSMAASLKAMHATIRRNIAAAVEAMPAEDYAFRPTPDVRSFGELVAHVAGANVFFCAQAKSETPSSAVLQNVTPTKAAMIKAVTDTLAYCDAIYAETTTPFITPVEMLVARVARRCEACCWRSIPPATAALRKHGRVSQAGALCRRRQPVTVSEVEAAPVKRVNLPREVLQTYLRTPDRPRPCRAQRRQQARAVVSIQTQAARPLARASRHARRRACARHPAARVGA
jgi:hypothetical protein